MSTNNFHILLHSAPARAALSRTSVHSRYIYIYNTTIEEYTYIQREIYHLYWAHIGYGLTNLHGEIHSIKIVIDDHYEQIKYIVYNIYLPIYLSIYLPAH